MAGGAKELYPGMPHFRVVTVEVAIALRAFDPEDAFHQRYSVASGGRKSDSLTRAIASAGISERKPKAKSWGRVASITTLPPQFVVAKPDCGPLPPSCWTKRPPGQLPCVWKLLAKFE